MRFVLAIAMFAALGRAADLNPIAKVLDNQVGNVENDVLRLALAMPADKFDFAPTNGTFTGVRTYAVQVKHIATVMYQCASAVLHEKAPVDLGPTDNGPENLKTKDQIIDYLKGAIAYAHKAMASVNEKNLMEQGPSPFGRGTMSRFEAANFIGFHSFDHYGQMVVYARMNGVIPGAPPAAPKGKSK
jgi:hypothetical protein